MYYLIGTDKAERDLQKAKMHVYDISEERNAVLASLQSILEFDRKTGNTNTDYSIFETDGKEIEIYRREHAYEDISAKTKEEDEEGYEGSALEIIDTIGAGISPLKDLQDHLYFFINDFLNEKDVDKKGGHYIASRLRAFLQTFDTLIDTVIDTLNDAIDLTEKRDGRGKQ